MRPDLCSKFVFLCMLLKCIHWPFVIGGETGGGLGHCIKIRCNFFYPWHYTETMLVHFPCWTDRLLSEVPYLCTIEVGALGMEHLWNTTFNTPSKHYWQGVDMDPLYHVSLRLNSKWLSKCSTSSTHWSVASSTFKLHICLHHHLSPAKCHSNCFGWGVVHAADCYALHIFPNFVLSSAALAQLLSYHLHNSGHHISVCLQQLTPSASCRWSSASMYTQNRNYPTLLYSIAQTKAS